MSFWPFRCFPWKEVTELFLDNFCSLTISKFYCVFHEIPRKSECKRLNSFQANNNSTEVFAIPDTDRRFFWRKVIFLDLFEFRFTLGILSSKILKHMVKESLIVPKVVICQTLNFQWKKSFYTFRTGRSKPSFIPGEETKQKVFTKVFFIYQQINLVEWKQTFIHPSSFFTAWKHLLAKTKVNYL